MRAVPPSPQTARSGVWLAALLLSAVTLATFVPVCGYSFVNYDDDFYVLENANVRAGLTRQSVFWACTSNVGFWHPVTWMSLQLDAQLYGLNPHGFHVTNLILHLGNTLLLFLVLRQLTGSVWRSALVAALFALHPLHVETVAWVAERKGVLSTFFALLTISAYARYAARPGVIRYLLVLIAFALGLAAKPMLVTLPAVLLLLDYWPLRRLAGTKRFEVATAARLVAEKTPLFILAATVALVTVVAEQKIGAVVEQPPLVHRMRGTLVHLVEYLDKTVRPVGLVPSYQVERQARTWIEAAGAALLLAAITFLALRRLGSRHLLVGWLWFIGTLLPVAGLVQVGVHRLADRYTYLPHVGLFVMLVWGLHELCRRTRWPRTILTVTAVPLVLACGVLSAGQIRHWRDGTALWEHTLAVSPDNPYAHANLGGSLYAEGKRDEAAHHYRASLRALPEQWQAHNGLGLILMDRGQLVDACAEFDRATAYEPNRGAVYENFGLALHRLGKYDEAGRCFAWALKLEPDLPLANLCLGLELLRSGQPEQAEGCFVAALKRQPEAAELHANLGAALFNQGRLDEALAEFTAAVRFSPNYVNGHLQLAVTQQRRGNLSAAVEQFRVALSLDPSLHEAHNGLGTALEGQGLTDEAVASFRRAIALAPAAVRYRCNLACVLSDLGRVQEAESEYAEATRVQPGWLADFDRTARDLATAQDLRRRWPELAVRLAREVCQATHEQRSEFLTTLALSYSAMGRRTESAAAAQKTEH